MKNTVDNHKIMHNNQNIRKNTFSINFHSSAPTSTQYRFPHSIVERLYFLSFHLIQVDISHNAINTHTSMKILHIENILFQH